MSDQIENRVIDAKSRGIYEAPGLALLHICYERLLSAIHNENATDQYIVMGGASGGLLYEGKWFDPEAMMLKDALARWIAPSITGQVTLELRRGDDYTIVSTAAPHMAYDPHKLSMEKVESLFSPEDRMGALEMQNLSVLDNREFLITHLDATRALAAGVGAARAGGDPGRRRIEEVALAGGARCAADDGGRALRKSGGRFFCASGGSGVNFSPMASTGVFPEAGLRGRLEQFGLATVLTFLDLERRSGELVVIADAKVGRLWLRQGRVVRARVEGSRRIDKSVIYESARARAGAIQLHAAGARQNGRRDQCADDAAAHGSGAPGRRGERRVVAVSALGPILARTPVAVIDDVLAVQRAIDAALPSTDGVACFNTLYLAVTTNVVTAERREGSSATSPS